MASGSSTTLRTSVRTPSSTGRASAPSLFFGRSFLRATDEYGRIACNDVIVHRETRQRRRIEVEELQGSIAQYGVLNPIIITKDLTLIAGERRLTASRNLGLLDIPFRYIEDLTPIEAQIIELEENVKRSDLDWRDDARAVLRLHQLYASTLPGWTQERTAKALSRSPSLISKQLMVAPELDSPRLADAPHLATACNILSRRADRQASDMLSEIIEMSRTVVPDEVPRPEPNKILSPEKTILQEDFIKWSSKYRGKPFNFVHCDFPYGIDLGGGAWSGKNSHHLYDDKPDVYFDLIRAFCGNLDNFMAPSAHLMFWFSMKFYNETLELFRELAPSLAFQAFPLFWYKSDNVGIMPDPKRGPRRNMETCFLASREDRLLVRSVSDTYCAPTDKKWHTSTKPVPMLKHFFQMFVDDGSRVLDPTCGSGASLRAAEEMGANFVLGLERDPEHCNNARTAMREFRLLRASK